MSVLEGAVIRTDDISAVSGRRKALRRLLRDRSAVVGLLVVALFVIGAAVAPWLSPHPPNDTDFANRFASPSAEHPLGTDHVGRDELSRILHGARLSLVMVLAATVGVTVTGLFFGLVSGMYGRFADSVIMRSADVLQALPTLILSLVVVGLLGQGLRNLIIVIALVAWPRFARIVRGMTFRTRERDFVQAARALGATRSRIVLRHIVPNLVGPVVVLSTLEMGRVLLLVSSLSFLGFGISPPTAEWGAMLSEARAFLDRAPQLLVYPGLAITLMVLAFNLAGDGLRDFLDPRTRDDSFSWEGRRRRDRTAGAGDRDPRRTEPASGPARPAEPIGA
ncbi:MAG: ABC transporter permease [Actinomycetota bacterium]|nr:ABC transporter permease [Actinomycetota bacterium]